MTNHKKSTIIFEGQERPKTKKEQHYVNNSALYDALVERKEQLKKAEEQGTPPPKVSEYIGKCIFQIAKNLGNKHQFSRYQYLDDMISDAIQNCIQYVDNFDPNKSKNPFAYFTQISYYAFINRIATEKKQLYIQFKSTTEAMALGDLADTDSDTSHMMDNLDIEQDFIEDYVSEYEEKNNLGPHKKTKRKSSPSHSILNYIS